MMENYAKTKNGARLLDYQSNIRLSNQSKVFQIKQSLSNQSNSSKKDNETHLNYLVWWLRILECEFHFGVMTHFSKTLIDCESTKLQILWGWILYFAVSEKFRWSRLRWTDIHEMKMKFTLTAPRVELFWVNAAIFPDTNLLTEKMFNFFSDKKL